jgi:hypothetical protein
MNTMNQSNVMNNEEWPEAALAAGMDCTSSSSLGQVLNKTK